MHGWAIMKDVKRSGPTVYGVLDRLEHRGWIVGYWEDQDPESSKPRRRFYRLTPDGLAGVRDLVAERRPEALENLGHGLRGRKIPGWQSLAPGSTG
jgi:PadR family transcriptional regulator, regulatory protein PadR